MSAANAADAAREVLQDTGLKLLALDLRGTLLRTPRVTALLPELSAQGVPVDLARLAQSRFDQDLRGPLQKRGDILDWTLFAATSMASMLVPHWRPKLDVRVVSDAFRARYLSEVRPLIEPTLLRRAVTTFRYRCVIVADGPYEREAAALRACFGTQTWMPPLISSQCLGVNKLTSEFFVRLGDRCGVSPASTVVVGDRWDKDVAIPGRAGCRGVLVGPGREGVPALGSLADLAPLLDGPVSRCAA